MQSAQGARHEHVTNNCNKQHCNQRTCTTLSSPLTILRCWILWSLSSSLFCSFLETCNFLLSSSTEVAILIFPLPVVTKIISMQAALIASLDERSYSEID